MTTFPEQAQLSVRASGSSPDSDIHRQRNVVTALAAELVSASRGISAPGLRTATDAPLTVRRLNLMRVGYLFMAVGLVLVKWPLLISGTVATLPVYEGVVAVLLTAMSLLAFLGLRYPVAMLPVLMFEVGW